MLSSRAAPASTSPNETPGLRAHSGVRTTARQFVGVDVAILPNDRGTPERTIEARHKRLVRSTGSA